jgi:preprotein translocase subunit SecA
VVKAGGLHIIGTERHESRRIDNQLRGRSGRQGDPGSSRFYLSMEDTLMRIFGDPTRTQRLLQIAGMKQGEVIESGLLTKQIERAQRKVESHNFDIRKQLLTFDDVANDQRKVVYHQRTEILGTPDLADAVASIRDDAVDAAISPFVPAQAGPGDWDLDGIAEVLLKDFSARVDPKAWLEENAEIDETSFRQRLRDGASAWYDAKVQRIGREIMQQVERDVLLRMLDQHWRDHLAAMDYLRQGIHLRGYAQKDYRYEYKRESFELFQAMLERVKHDTASMLARVEIRSQEEVDREEAEQRERLMRALQAQHAEAQSALMTGGDDVVDASFGGAPSASAAGQSATRDDRKVGRNEPCPCGSGKKYKQCHGAL